MVIREGVRRYYVTLYATGLVLLFGEVRRPGARVTLREIKGTDTPLARQLTRLARGYVDADSAAKRDALERDDALPVEPKAAVLPDGGLILPPSPPPAPTTMGYLTVIGARRLAEELLIAARQVEEAVNLVGPDAGTHRVVRAGAYIAMRIEA